MNEPVKGAQVRLFVFLRIILCVIDWPDRHPRKIEQVGLGSPAVRRDEELRSFEVFAQFVGRNRATLGVGELMRSPVRAHDHVVNRREERFFVRDQTVLLFLAPGINDPSARLGSASHHAGHHLEEHLHGIAVVDDVEHARSERGNQVGGGRVTRIALPLVLGRLILTHVHIQLTARLGNVPGQTTRVSIHIQLGRLIVRPEGETSHHWIFGRGRTTTRNHTKRSAITAFVEDAKGPVRQLVDPLGRHRDMTVSAFGDPSGHISDFATLGELPSREKVITKTLDPVLIIAKLLGPLRNRRGIGVDNGVIDFLPSDHGFVQIHEMLRFRGPSLQIHEIGLEFTPVHGLHLVVRVELVGEILVPSVVPLPNRPGLRGPSFRRPDGGRLPNLGDHEVDGLLAHLLGLKSVRIGVRGPVLAGRQREEGQDEDGREGHHGEDGDEGDASTILGEKPAGLEGFRKFHGWDGVGFPGEKKGGFVLGSALQCKLKEIQRQYKTILPVRRFFAHTMYLPGVPRRPEIREFQQEDQEFRSKTSQNTTVLGKRSPHRLIAWSCSSSRMNPG